MFDGLNGIPITRKPEEPASRCVPHPSHPSHKLTNLGRSLSRPISTVSSSSSSPQPIRDSFCEINSIKTVSEYHLRRPASFSDAAVPRSPFYSSLRRRFQGLWPEKVRKSPLCETRSSNSSWSTSKHTHLNSLSNQQLDRMVDPASAALTATADVPCYISARSANSLISESRPTRIQTEALLVLNCLLDELLLLLLNSAKSLATDRIKSDGMLKLLNNNLLAKDAVLEAELELRSYVETKRSEGAKVPLGLMATSRLDGSEHFPVDSAYEALRIRCQYYSTLGDREDDSAVTDQNIMSSEGRPIATITQGVAIYVTALLEFVGEHILKNVAGVVERDNSDEASIYDLKAAITEDEQLRHLYDRMSIKQDITRRIDTIENHRVVKSDHRAAKPWQVPTEDDYNEAAGPALFTSKRSSMHAKPLPDLSSGMQGRSTLSSLGHGSNGGRASITSFATSTSHGPSIASTDPSTHQSALEAAVPSASVAMGRRPSSERSWSGVFGKRRNSLRLNADTSASLAKSLSPVESASRASKSASLDPTDDFEALMMSSQTMKVSLTSNRLRTIEVAKEAEARKDANRKRPGTATVSSTLQEGKLASSPMYRHSLSQERPSDSVTFHNSRNNSNTSISTAIANNNKDAGAQSSVSASPNLLTRPERKLAPPPPSSYRSPSPALLGINSPTLKEPVRQAGTDDQMSPTRETQAFSGKLKPREGPGDRMSARELADLFQSTPPTAVLETFSGNSFKSSDMEPRRRSGVGERVRNLFGRKSSGTEQGTPSSPHYPPTVLTQTDGDNGRGDSFDILAASAVASSEHVKALASLKSLPNSPSGDVSDATGRMLVSQRPTTAARSVSSTNDHTPSSPDVSLTESVGRGAPPLAMAAVRTVSARSLDRFSRSSSQTHSISEVGEPVSDHPSRSSIAGVYRESATGTLDSFTSPTLKPKSTPVVAGSVTNGVGVDVPSRKVQWGYKRTSSTLGHPVDRNGTPTSDRRRSGGYQSPSGHSHVSAVKDDTARLERDLPPTPSPLPQEENDGYAVGVTPEHAHQRSTTQGSTISSKACSGGRELLHILADLEKTMRGCSSVSECRAVVNRAMHAEKGLSLPDSSQLNLKESQAPSASLTTTAVSGIVDATTSDDTSRYALLANKSNLVNAVDQQRLVFAWLLGGDETPMFDNLALTDATTDVAEVNQSSFDSQSRARRYSSGVTSVQSNYKDAEGPM